MRIITGAGSFAPKKKKKRKAAKIEIAVIHGHMGRKCVRKFRIAEQI